jgi:hypothetical protein
MQVTVFWQASRIVPLFFDDLRTFSGEKANVIRNLSTRQCDAWISWFFIEFILYFLFICCHWFQIWESPEYYSLENWPEANTKALTIILFLLHSSHTYIHTYCTQNCDVFSEYSCSCMLAACFQSLSVNCSAHKRMFYLVYTYVLVSRVNAINLFSLFSLRLKRCPNIGKHSVTESCSFSRVLSWIRLHYQHWLESHLRMNTPGEIWNLWHVLHTWCILRCQLFLTTYIVQRQLHC